MEHTDSGSAHADKNYCNIQKYQIVTILSLTHLPLNLVSVRNFISVIVRVHIEYMPNNTV